MPILQSMMHRAQNYKAQPKSRTQRELSIITADIKKALMLQGHNSTFNYFHLTERTHVPRYVINLSQWWEIFIKSISWCRSFEVDASIWNETALMLILNSLEIYLFWFQSDVWTFSFGHILKNKKPLFRVAKCHWYGKYVRVKIFAGCKISVHKLA